MDFLPKNIQRMGTSTVTLEPFRIDSDVKPIHRTSITTTRMEEGDVSSPSQDGDTILSLQKQIKSLTAAVASLQAGGGSDELGKPSDVRTDTADEAEEGDEAILLQFGQTKIVPKIRKCNFAEFKNRFNIEEGRYCVDVLMSNSLEESEIHEEMELRQEVVKQDSKHKSKTAKGKAPVPAARLGGKGIIQSEKVEEKWISRIRIQSPAVLSTLAKVLQESWSMKPRTFFRPFCPLIFFHERMKEALRGLEERWGDIDSGAVTGTATPSQQDDQSDDILNTPGFGVHHNIDDSPEALIEMRCYVEFIDREVMPLFTQFDHCDELTKTKIRFHDLWYLFRAGEMIYRPIPNDTEKTNTLSSRQRAWRTFELKLPSVRYRTMAGEHKQYVNDDSDEATSAFVIRAYHIDYTGEEFCVVTEEFRIQRFEGERSIRSLNVYPWRFVSNHAQTLKHFEKCGSDNFVHYIETRHSLYNWWTLVLDPRGNPAMDMDGNLVKHPEHVNSEVIVDFVEAFQVCPGWQPQRTILSYSDPNPTSTADEFYIRWWSDSDRTKLVAETSEIIQLKSGVCTYQRNHAIRHDAFLQKVRENDKEGRLTKVQHIRQVDLPLLPIRVYAYVLQDRKFVQIDSQRLRPVRESFNALDSLKINLKHKETLQALVQAHFMKKAIEKEAGIEGLAQDLIPGKGKGVFVLLHGVPGVGKTATAEAIAQANGKPLFAITCGDLGLTPKDVERALRGIFRLAHIWDCVLLLDEVDTFFTTRSRGDSLTKNALVSVFLRVLEYYNGILFLTTNRPGALDEAFKSRIHLKLYYPPLSEMQTHDIWQVNIERLRLIEEQRCDANPGEQPLQIFEQEIMKFASQQFHNREERGRWNGRQIRNAFQIAASLALFDARKRLGQRRERDPDAVPIRPKLDVEHFSMIDHITAEFDEYMEETVGKNDADRAHEASDRADYWGQRRSGGGSGGEDYGVFPASVPNGGGWFGGYRNGSGQGGSWRDSGASVQRVPWRGRPSGTFGGGMAGYDDAAGSPNMKHPGWSFEQPEDQRRPGMKGGPSNQGFGKTMPQSPSEFRGESARFASYEESLAATGGGQLGNNPPGGSGFSAGAGGRDSFRSGEDFPPGAMAQSGGSGSGFGFARGDPSQERERMDFSSHPHGNSQGYGHRESQVFGGGFGTG